MPDLTKVRDAAVGFLAAFLPEVPRVEAFFGALDTNSAAAKRLQVGVSLFVTALSAENTAPPNSHDLDMLGSFGVLVVAYNKQSPEAGERAALAIADKIALAVHGQRFGLDDIGPAKVLAMENIADQGLETSNLYVWSVLWQQSIAFTGGA